MAIKNKTQYPSQSIPEGTDGGFVRFEAITLSELPPLKPQAQEITDRGIVRFGSSMITSER